jgi:hypothetical protein
MVMMMMMIMCLGQAIGTARIRGYLVTVNILWPMGTVNSGYRVNCEQIPTAFGSLTIPEYRPPRICWGWVGGIMPASCMSCTGRVLNCHGLVLLRSPADMEHPDALLQNEGVLGV